MACGTRRAPEKFQQKLVILGFDGMDPRLVQKWMDEGKLPNMQKLAKRGSGVRPLATTHSPESPTAWASFATGVNAGKHNIYDFLVRDTHTYLPDLGMVHARAAALRPQLHPDLASRRSPRSAAARRSGSRRATPACARAC